MGPGLRRDDGWNCGTELKAMALDQSLYDRDFFAWANQQASLLRAGSFGDVDIENLAEEIESLGRREKWTLSNHLEALLTLLLRWTVQPSLQSRAWQLLMEKQRRKIARYVEESPSLKPLIPAMVGSAYEFALLRAEIETGFDESKFPTECPWPLKNVLKANWLPK
jgi:hypothetical protein